MPEPSPTEQLLGLLVAEPLGGGGEVNPKEHLWEAIDPRSAVDLFGRFLRCLVQGVAFPMSMDAVCGQLQNEYPQLFDYEAVRSVDVVRQHAPRVLEAFGNVQQPIDGASLRTFLHAIMPASVRDKTHKLPFIVTWNDHHWSWFIHQGDSWYSVLRQYNLGGGDAWAIPAPSVSPFSMSIPPRLRTEGFHLSNQRQRAFHSQWKNLIDMVWGLVSSGGKSTRDPALQELIKQLLGAFLLKVHEEYLQPATTVPSLQTVEDVVRRSGFFL